MLGLKLNHVSKRGHWPQWSYVFFEFSLSYQELSWWIRIPLNESKKFQYVILFCHIGIFLYRIVPIQWIFSQHCRYWLPGALASGHEKLQHWIHTRVFLAGYGFIPGSQMCIIKLSIIGSDNAFLSVLYQAITCSKTITYCKLNSKEETSVIC